MADQQEQLGCQARADLPWLTEEDDVVVELYLSHATEDIGVRLGRTWAAVKGAIARLRSEGKLPSGQKPYVRRSRVHRERAPSPQRLEPARDTRGMRRCLGDECGRMFNSAGPGNRLCDKCSERLDQIGSPSRGCY